MVRSPSSPRPRARVALALVLVAAACDGSAAPVPTDAPSPDPRPHIVHVFTDDQRWDSMPGVRPELVPQDVFGETRAALMDRGVTFSYGYNTNPLCAPARGSVLAGGYLTHHTGVLTNQPPFGAAQAFRDAKNLGTLLQERGYRTAFIGKYLNGHPGLTGTDSQGRAIPRRTYVPPGWDLFLHRQFTPGWNENAFVVGTSTATSPEAGILLPGQSGHLEGLLFELQQRGLPKAVAQVLAAYDFDAPPYVTSFEGELALALLEDARTSTRPWFVLIAVEPPHQPAIPEEVDHDVYQGFTWRPPGVLEEDLSDKPPHVARAARRFAARPPIGPYDTPDELWQRMLESLRSLDRLVGAIARKVDESPELADRTAIFFTSDNGYLWGEHGLRTKRYPYEESIRSPMIARVPGIAPGVRDVPVAVNLDVPATVLALAGASPAELADEIQTDGQNLLPILRDPSAPFREHAFCQGFGTEVLGGNVDDPVWAAVVKDGVKVIEYGYRNADGSPVLEVYDLERDPDELESRHADPDYAGAISAARAILATERGLAIVDVIGVDADLPDAVQGEPYEHRLSAAGGTPPLSWSLHPKLPPGPLDRRAELRLPPGVALEPEGTLRGTPTAAGIYEFVVVVTDSSRSPQHGGPERHGRRVRVRVASATGGD